MTAIDVKDGRADTLARMAASRAELRELLDSTVHDGQPEEGGEHGTFPRSRTMRLLMSGRGLGTIGALLGGLLIARPALLLRLLRLVPSGAVGRVLLVKAISALRSRGARRSTTA